MYIKKKKNEGQEKRTRDKEQAERKRRKRWGCKGRMMCEDGSCGNVEQTRTKKRRDGQAEVDNMPIRDKINSANDRVSGGGHRMTDVGMRF